MLHNVSQRLLHDPKKAPSYILADVARDVMMNEANFYAVLFRDFSAEAPHCGDQSLKIQFHGMKLARQVVQVA